MFNYKKITANDRRNVNANFPYLVLAASIFITIGIAYNFYQNSLYKDSIRFDNEVGQTKFAIENKINLYIALLKSGRGFMESSTELNKEIFAGYVDSLEIEKNYPGLQAVGYSKVNTKPEHSLIKNSLEVQNGFPTQVLSENKLNSSPIIVFIKSEDKNANEEKSFSKSSETYLNDFFEVAKNSGNAVLSSKVKFYEESEQTESSGFFIVLPIYKQIKSITAVERAARKPSGYIFGAVGANDFLTEIRKNISTTNIGVKIYENENKPENMLAQGALNVDKNINGSEKSNFSTFNVIYAGKIKWIVEYNSLPAFDEESSGSWTLLVILAGVFFSFLLFSIIYTEVASRINLQQTADKLIVLQKQKQILLENEQSARKSAERANRTKDEFIAVVSHELKTPLNAISGWTNILRTKNLPDPTKKLALDKIEKNLHAQARLVEEILEYSQIISGTISLNRKKVNFSEVFENTFFDFEPKAREKNIELIKDNRLDGHNILGDDEKIKLVIGNIFSNAIKFTHPGGRIKAVITEGEGNLRMCIKDNGDGISAEFLPFIFEKFRQADASITRSGGGLGLGLTISNHIVRLHEGTIEANSEGKGKGSVFIVKLPLLIHDA